MAELTAAPSRTLEHHGVGLVWWSPGAVGCPWAVLHCEAAPDLLPLTALSEYAPHTVSQRSGPRSLCGWRGGGRRWAVATHLTHALDLSAVGTGVFASRLAGGDVALAAPDAPTPRGGGRPDTGELSARPGSAPRVGSPATTLRGARRNSGRKLTSVVQAVERLTVGVDSASLAVEPPVEPVGPVAALTKPPPPKPKEPREAPKGGQKDGLKDGQKDVRPGSPLSASRKRDQTPKQKPGDKPVKGKAGKDKMKDKASPPAATAAAVAAAEALLRDPVHHFLRCDPLWTPAVFAQTWEAALSHDPAPPSGGLVLIGDHGQLLLLSPSGAFAAQPDREEASWVQAAGLVILTPHVAEVVGGGWFVLQRSAFTPLAPRPSVETPAWSRLRRRLLAVQGSQDTPLAEPTPGLLGPLLEALLADSPPGADAADRRVAARWRRCLSVAWWPPHRTVNALTADLGADLGAGLDHQALTVMEWPRAV